MEEFTVEQLMQSMQAWKPTDDILNQITSRLNREEIVPELREVLASGLLQCAGSTYRYIQYIHDCASVQELNAKNLLPQVAQLGALVADLKTQAQKYEGAFQKYNEAIHPRLKKDTFDTYYYDAILGLDLRETLKSIIGEVEVLLQSMTLVSGELTGLQCIEIYENCIRYQLFLHYLLLTKKLSVEELWSVLFDVYNLLKEVENPAGETTSEDLSDLHARVKNYKAN
jgi:hypothetical protein